MKKIVRKIYRKFHKTVKHPSQVKETGFKEVSFDINVASFLFWNWIDVTNNKTGATGSAMDHDFNVGELYLTATFKQMDGNRDINKPGFMVLAGGGVGCYGGDASSFEHKRNYPDDPIGVGTWIGGGATFAIVGWGFSIDWD